MKISKFYSYKTEFVVKYKKSKKTGVSPLSFSTVFVLIFIYSRGMFQILQIKKVKI